MCKYVHIPFKAKSITNFTSLLKKNHHLLWVSLSRENPLIRQHIVQIFQKEPGFHRRAIIKKGKGKKTDFDENMVNPEYFGIHNPSKHVTKYEQYI